MALGKWRWRSIEFPDIAIGIAHRFSVASGIALVLTVLHSSAQAQQVLHTPARQSTQLSVLDH
jgi:hypothetical protein